MPTTPTCVQVDMTMAAEAIKRSFPLFPGADAAMEVTVSAGEMLYIPTGECVDLLCVCVCVCGGEEGVNTCYVILQSRGRPNRLQGLAQL